MKTDNNTYTLKADINNIYTLPEHNIFPLLMPLISQKQHWSSLYKSLWAHQTLQSTEPNRMAKPTAQRSQRMPASTNQFNLIKHHKNPANLGKSSHYWSINSGPSVLSDSFTNHYTITDPSKFRSLIKTNLNERNTTALAHLEEIVPAESRCGGHASCPHSGAAPSRWPSPAWTCRGRKCLRVCQTCPPAALEPGIWGPLRWHHSHLVSGYIRITSLSNSLTPWQTTGFSNLIYQ